MHLLPCNNELVRQSHWTYGLSGFRKLEKEIKILLSQNQIPEKGWSDEEISLFPYQYSLIDSNNHRDISGVGEREGRVFNGLLRTRCFGMTHGLGRSGDITADQPKAPGSSYLYKLTNRLTVNFLKSVSGLTSVKDAVVLPMCTGMALTHVFHTIQHQFTKSSRKYVLISQIDQQTCVKCILYAGLQPIIIPLQKTIEESIPEGGSFWGTNVRCFEDTINEIGNENVLCVLSTVSCFSPRLPDSIMGLSQLCKKHDIPHVVNMAYALQSKYSCAMTQKALHNTECRVDALVFSTDKNFLVPVGGSVIASTSKTFINLACQIYPGRAGAYPIHDLLISFLSLGKTGFRQLYEKREKLLSEFQTMLRHFAEEKREIVFVHKENDISFSMSLKNIIDDNKRCRIGADLYSHGITGSRVIVFDGKEKSIGSLVFESFGSHRSRYRSNSIDVPQSIRKVHLERQALDENIPYLTVACAIGMEASDSMRFMETLRKVYEKYDRRE